jgi:hypothetical protein
LICRGVLVSSQHIVAWERLTERVILSAGAMLIFSVSFQIDQMPEGVVFANNRQYIGTKNRLYRTPSLTIAIIRRHVATRFWPRGAVVGARLACGLCVHCSWQKPAPGCPPRGEHNNSDSQNQRSAHATTASQVRQHDVLNRGDSRQLSAL